MASILASAWKPRRSARGEVKAPGQLLMIRWISASGCQRICCTAWAPAVRCNAATMSLTCTESPGTMRERAAKAGDGTGEDQPWWAGKSAARLQHRQGAVQVDTHTQVEISFGRSAHHRSEVEDTGSAVIDDLGQGRTVRDIPGGHVQPWV